MTNRRMTSYQRDVAAKPALKRRQSARSHLDDIEFLKSRNLTEKDVK